ncbi:MAG: hypothetical protein IPG44_03970 [Anaerolineales bacterium]|jgi:hypothetical protein|nr:hypothetical protein [Chloroflexota bacterium]MBK6644902.1 hypothetical protein [Anaerolineales bacterium]MCC6985922.1 hypothetical protein [Anaerolineales bacterium]
MNRPSTPVKKSPAPEILILIAVSAAVFLPYAFQLTYYLDDWYFVYNNAVRGPNVFHEMFSIDRPARGYFFDIFFTLFGAYPPAHHLATYAWMLAGGIGAFWLLNVLWEENRPTNVLIALLFVLYPGYTWWVTIEYQPISASLALQIFSVLFSLLAIRAGGAGLKLMYAAGALAAGFAYPALVEYAVGAEMFRFLCIHLLVSRSQPNRFFSQTAAAFKSWLLYASSALGFVFWRVFLFESGRKATDVDLFAGKFADQPFSALTDIGNRLYISITNAGVGAWYKPLYSRGGELAWDLPARSLVLTGLVAVVLAFHFLWMRQRFANEGARAYSMPREAVALGLISLVSGAIPVVFFGRFINLSVYSHYGLPVSLAAAILLAGLVCLPPLKGLRHAILSGFVLASVLAHSLLAEKTVILEESLASFWWQASWRIPALRPDATLVTVYPHPNIVDGDLGLPEAANLIYFPEPRDERPLRYPISAIMPTDENIENILAGKHGRTEGYRTFEMVIRYDNILILAQPTPASCVRVITGENHLPSEMDSEDIAQISRFSKIENVRLIENQIPPAYAFGAEPAHGWCYYFEKADLAIQEADWERAALLGGDALALGLAPADPVEWYPFLQAYAVTGDADSLKQLARRIAGETTIRLQACEWLMNTEAALTDEVRETIDVNYCKGSE